MDAGSQATRRTTEDLVDAGSQVTRRIIDMNLKLLEGCSRVSPPATGILLI